MRRCAILGSGPTLGRTWRDAYEYDLVLCINRAALAVDRGVWVFGDHPVYDQCPEVAKDRPIFTRRSSALRIAATHPEDLGFIGRCRLFEEVQFLRDHFGKQRAFSLWAALSLALHEGFSDIDMFGVDWLGLHDFDGWEHPVSFSRSEERWGAEAGGVRLILNAHPQSVTVRRIQPETIEEMRSSPSADVSDAVATLMKIC